MAASAPLAMVMKMTGIRASMPADLLVDLQAGLVGQTQVEQNDIGRVGADALEPLGAGAGHFDPVTGGGERLAHLLRDQGRVVIDEQQVGHDLVTPFPGLGILFAIVMFGSTGHQSIPAGPPSGTKKMPETNVQPPLPPDEAARLAVLRSLEILDTASEESFDELTALAASICQTPIALVSLIDQDRQWFKSRFGWAATATPRDVSFAPTRS